MRRRKKKLEKSMKTTGVFIMRAARAARSGRGIAFF
jgi:hypothetical protein